MSRSACVDASIHPSLAVVFLINIYAHIHAAGKFDYGAQSQSLPASFMTINSRHRDMNLSATSVISELI
jgi:hypothetical protein